MKFFEKLLKQKNEIEAKLRFNVKQNNGENFAGIFFNGEYFQFEAMSIVPETAIEMANWILKLTGNSVLEEIKEMKDYQNEKM